MKNTTIIVIVINLKTDNDKLKQLNYNLHSYGMC